MHSESYGNDKYLMVICTISFHFCYHGNVLQGVSGSHGDSRKKKKKTKEDFYQFQQRDSQRQAIAELRKKFLKDKKKVEELKAQRKFNPF